MLGQRVDARMSIRVLPVVVNDRAHDGLPVNPDPASTDVGRRRAGSRSAAAVRNSNVNARSRTFGENRYVVSSTLTVPTTIRLRGKGNRSEPSTATHSPSARASTGRIGRRDSTPKESRRSSAQREQDSSRRVPAGTAHPALPQRGARTQARPGRPTPPCPRRPERIRVAEEVLRAGPVGTHRNDQRPRPTLGIAADPLAEPHRKLGLPGPGLSGDDDERLRRHCRDERGDEIRRQPQAADVNSLSERTGRGADIIRRRGERSIWWCHLASTSIRCGFFRGLELARDQQLGVRVKHRGNGVCYIGPE